MVDTSVEYALKLSIDEFNQWCVDSYQEAKHTLNDLKGIFFNKLTKNLKGTNLVPNYWDWRNYRTDCIGNFEIKNNRITNLSFAPENSHSLAVKENIKTLQTVLDRIDYKSTIDVIDDFAKQIESFQIKR